MKVYFTVLFSMLAIVATAQGKYSYTHFDKLTEVKGTAYVVASVDAKMKTADSVAEYLLFVNTCTGQANQVNFSDDGPILRFEQAKIDSLGINKIIVSAKTVDLDGKSGIDWNDPTQIFVLSADGQRKEQLTDSNFFVRAWAVNKESGTIVISGHHDTNGNNKYDKNDKSQILMYDLESLKLKGSL